MALQEQLLNKHNHGFSLFLKDVPLLSDFLQTLHFFILADLCQLIEVIPEGLDLPVGQFAEASHADERFGPIPEHYSELEEELILDGHVAADALVLFSQLLCVDLFFSDNPVCGLYLFLFEHFQKTQEDVMQLRKIKVVKVVFLLSQDLVKDLKLSEHIFFEGKTLLIHSLFHQLLQLLLEVHLTLAEDANDLPPQ